MKELDKIRQSISLIDKEMANLFEQRMELVSKVAAIKKAEGLSVLDIKQEEKVLQRAAENIQDKLLQPYFLKLMKELMSLSKQYQRQICDGLFGLIGEHLEHSCSPEIHSLLGNEGYTLIELKPEQLEVFFKERKFKGINVTIPYKQAVIPYLDHISEEAEAIGAVNTIVNRNGELWGYNTDHYGFIALARESGLDFRGAKVLILGRGGAALAAASAAKEMGAGEIVNAVRTPSDGQLPIDGDKSLFQDFDILVNATPVGMFPNIDECPFDITKIPDLKGVLDCIYNPLRTTLATNAIAAGIPAAGGMTMLVAQACKAHSLFTGNSVSCEEQRRIVDTITSGTENIVLCGMPSCGKSTIGKMTAEKLGREFIDTDDLIVEREGRSIPEIFEAEGEEGFRLIESKIIKEISVRRSCVIALGGGAIINPENVRLLKMNGRIVFIHRDLSLLNPGDGRPLSHNKEDLEKLWAERKELYLAAADQIISNNGNLDTNSRIPFTKMQGLGNDYVYIDTGKYKVENPSELAKKVSDRRTGIGSDGLVLIGSSNVADFSMRIFNADGSEAQMCGNAARCIGKYVTQRGLCNKRDISLETISGIKKIHVLSNKISVEMGGYIAKEMKVQLAERVFEGIAVNVGNPHFVIFGSQANMADVEKFGPLLEKHPAFPEGTNVEFACWDTSGRIRMRVWERGSGITMACGTGACATAAAALFLEHQGSSCERVCCCIEASAETVTYTIEMDGGALDVSICNGEITMSGPAEFVFDGEMEI